MIRFLSTLSLRRATTYHLMLKIGTLHFYPRSPCGERRVKPILREINTRDFYPRSPCGERPSSTVIVILRKNFYPRSPCGERRSLLTLCPFLLCKFLSTLSLRRATYNLMIHHKKNKIFLSTLSLRRATSLGLLGWLRVLISIHALLAESDPSTTRRLTNLMISIHALLAESDPFLLCKN